MRRQRSKSTTRRFRTRTTGVVYVIAIEGRATEKKYFDCIIQNVHGCTISIVPRKWNRTEPMQVLGDLLDFKAKNARERKTSDKYWLVIDHDNTDEVELRRVIDKAKANKVCVADSRPCFEVWLLAHFAQLHHFENLESGGRRACSPAERHLQKVDSTYNKDNKGKYKASDYMGKIDQAIANTKTEDRNPTGDLLEYRGSRVYKLIESIRNFSTSPNNA